MLPKMVALKGPSWLPPLPMSSLLNYAHNMVAAVLLFICLFVVFKVADLAAEDTPQLYMACGRGAHSTLRVLRHGLEVRVLLKLLYC